MPSDDKPDTVDLQSGIRGWRSWSVKRRVIVVIVILWLAYPLIDALGMLVAIWLPALQRARHGPEWHQGVGQSLTFLQLEPLTGDPLRLSLGDLQGRVLLLNFWGTWCPPCRAELPHMAALRERFSGRDDFRLVAISYPSGGDLDVPSLREATSALLKRMTLDVPTYYDPDRKTQAAVDRVIGFEGFPTNVLLDRHGVIRAIWVGYEPGVEGEIEKYVDKLLSET